MSEAPAFKLVLGNGFIEIANNNGEEEQNR